MVRIPTGDALTGAPRKLVWNAWDQLVEVRDAASNTLLQRNTYDALYRRTTRQPGSGAVIHTYYNNQWRPVEERTGTSTSPVAIYFWGIRHRDDLVRRDRAISGTGPLNETLWCLMDYFDPVAVINSSGAVQERYAYSAFGVPLILAPDYSVRSSSSVAWEFLFHGQFTDAETGYQNYGFRYYLPALGRWLSRDPAGEVGGDNLYGFARNESINNLDLLGLIFPGAGGAAIAAAIVLAEAALNICPGQYKCKEGCEACCSTAEAAGLTGLTVAYTFALATDCVAAALIGPWGALACIALYTAIQVGAVFNLSQDIQGCHEKCNQKPSEASPDCCKEKG